MTENCDINSEKVKIVLQYFYLTWMLQKKVSTIQQSELCLFSRIYENLPEVQRRKEEERRKAEYRTYRLNAQLYNKVLHKHTFIRRCLI